MKIVKNEKLIERNGKIGSYLSLGALAVLGVGMYISIAKSDLFYWSLIALITGFIMTQIGMYFSNRFGRTPRPDEQLDASMKGLPNETILYHYKTPATHLLVGPAGIWVLLLFHQRGKVTYSKNRWKLSGGGFMQAYMTLFGQEGIGRPDFELENQISSLKKYLIKQGMEESAIPEINGVLVFTNNEADVDDTDAPVPALQIKKLKDFMRQKAKEQSLSALTLQAVTAALPQE
jgi:hypothetical protein